MNLAPLLSALREGQLVELAPDDVEQLLTWLVGRKIDAPDEPVPLPDPGDDPVLVQLVLFRIDATIFNGGRLNIAAAGVTADHPDDIRRVRFRRLASAFHPDRFPRMGDWMTERSQSIHQAYAAFKRGELPPHAPAPATPGTDVYTPRDRPTREQASPKRQRSRPALRRFLLGLRRRFGHDRWLAHKLIGAAALLAMLPVLNLWLAPGPTHSDISELARSQSLVRPPPDAPDSNASQPEDVESAAGAEPTISSAEGAGARTEGDQSPDFGNADAREAETVLATSWESPPVTDSPDREPMGFEEIPAEQIPPLLLAARQVMDLDGDGQSNSADLPTIDQQLIEMGLATDAERIYRKMNRLTGSDETFRMIHPEDEIHRQTDEQRRHTRASEAIRVSASEQVPTPPPQVSSENAVETESDQTPRIAAQVRAPDPSETVRRAAPSAGADLATSISVQTDSGRRQPHDNGGALPNTPVATEATDPWKDESPPEPATAERVEPVGKASQSIAPGELILGPSQTSRVGQVLAGFHAALETGDIDALLSLMADDVRIEHGRGRDEAERHFRTLLNGSESNRVDLRMLRLERDGELWQAETELLIEVGEPAPNIVRTGRAVFQLAAHRGSMRIRRLER